MALDRDKIKEQGIRIIEEFSEKLKSVPDTKETHYVVDMKNITRKDAPPVKCEGFRDRMKRIAPKWEEDSIVAEKAE